MSQTFEIDKLRIWSAGEWKTYNTNSIKLTNVIIRFHYDQLFILSENKLLESLNLNDKIKGIYKNDVLILITCNSLHQIRKIKFQIKRNIAECFYILSRHFPIVSYNNASNSQFKAKYRKIEDILKSAINEKGAGTGPPLPSNLNDFVKLCLLDPNFPNLVGEVQDILKKLNI